MSAKVVEVLKDIEVAVVDDLLYVYEDSGLLKEVETNVSRLDLLKFMKARDYTTRITPVTGKPSSAPAPAPAPVRDTTPPSPHYHVARPPTPPKSHDLELERKKLELLEMERRLYEEQEKLRRRREASPPRKVNGSDSLKLALEGVAASSEAAKKAWADGKKISLNSQSHHSLIL